MSKLTDKIEALIGKQSPEQLMAGDIDRHIATILADVRELERINAVNWEAYKKLEADQYTAARMAYENARQLCFEKGEYEIPRPGDDIADDIAEQVDAIDASAAGSFTRTRETALISQAKREAYEHALTLLDSPLGAEGTRVHLDLAIDALDNEGGST